MKNALLIMGICLLVTGCATSRYQPKNYWGVGYSEAEIEPGVYFLEYTADEYSSMSDAVKFWHQRAMELCTTKGQKGYEMFDPKQDISSPYAVGGIAGAITALLGIYKYPVYTAYLRCTEKPGSILNK